VDTGYEHHECFSSRISGQFVDETLHVYTLYTGITYYTNAIVHYNNIIVVSIDLVNLINQQQYSIGIGIYHLYIIPTDMMAGRCAIDKLILFFLETAVRDNILCLQIFTTRVVCVYSIYIIYIYIA